MTAAKELSIYVVLYSLLTVGEMNEIFVKTFM